MHTNEWLQEKIDTGIEFGYPKCCIDSFVEFCKTLSGRTEAQSDPKVHKHYGFIPCDTHAKQILAGEIKIQDLIKDRKFTLSFPNDGHKPILILE